jgi:predicted methyltransferase
MMRASILLLVACSATPAAKPPETAQPPSIDAALASTDRDPVDRALDAGRKPAQLMKFFGIAAGQHVAELTAGGGYTSEILARIVGDKGLVYAQNPKFILEKFAEKPWSERLKKPIMRQVVRVDRELDDPLPEEAKNLDVVLMILTYHDTVWLNVDRAKMNKSVFNALKPGGVFGIVDHSARAGSGVEDVQTLHRIDEKVVRDEIAAAGFKLTEEATFLRNADDARDWNASPMKAGEKRGTSDRFVLKFVKP